MNLSVLITFVLIVLARIADMTLDTVRTASIVQGRRAFSAALGFFQAIIYLGAVAKVLLNMDHLVYGLAYALGFALGTYFGIALEQHLAFGQQSASLFTRKGAALGAALAAAGYRVAVVDGHVPDGELTILYVEVLRSRARELIREAAIVDAMCFCIVSDVRTAGYAAHHVS